MAICAKCKQNIPDGEQVAVWDNSSGAVRVFFLCQRHAKEMQDAGLVEEVTDEFKEIIDDKR